MALSKRWLTLQGALCITAELVLGRLVPGLRDLNSGAAPAAGVGLRVEVSAMLSLVAIANRTRERFPA